MRPEPVRHNERSHRSEKFTHHNYGSPRAQSPCATTREATAVPFKGAAEESSSCSERDGRRVGLLSSSLCLGAEGAGRTGLCLSPARCEPHRAPASQLQVEALAAFPGKGQG